MNECRASLVSGGEDDDDDGHHSISKQQAAVATDPKHVHAGGLAVSIRVAMFWYKIRVLGHARRHGRTRIEILIHFD